MNAQLLEIQPSKELKFIFELKKQCSCSVQLTNNTHHYVAFKVKTTSPKKYCVQPNAGVISPKSTRGFTVIMQAQREVPPDMICKDKFLIQSTVVSIGTADEDITAAIFAKDDGRHVEESKLKVALVSPPSSPVLSPINGTLKQKPEFEDSILKEPVFSNVGFTPLQKARTKVEELMLSGEDLKPVKDVEWKPKKDIGNGGDVKPIKNAELNPVNKTVNGGDFKPMKATDMNLRKDIDNNEDLKPINGVELRPRKDLADVEGSRPLKDAELQPRNVVDNSKDVKPLMDMEPRLAKDVDYEEIQLANKTELNDLKDGDLTRKVVEETKLVKDIEEMKLKLNDLESKLGEAEVTISKLTQERKLSTQERKILQEELAMLRREKGVRHVQVGFPLLFVCMIALVSVFVGYLLHS